MKKAILITMIALVGSAGFAQTSDTVNLTATVGTGSGSFLTVEPAAVAFGTVNPSPSDHRFESNILTAEFFAATAPWEIRTFTANAGDEIGMVDGSGNALPLKFNQANFGSGDPEVDANWTGNAAVWKGVFDDDTVDGGGNPFFSTLGSSASLDVTPIEFTFAIDAVGAVKASYGTTVNFELYLE